MRRNNRCICFTFTKVKSLAKLVSVLLISISLTACFGKSSDEHIAEAKVFIEKGDEAAAIIELKNAIQLDPNYALARFELGKVYISQKDFQSAEKELSRAIELGYSKSEVMPFLSEAYQRIGANVALQELDISEVNLTSVEILKINFRKMQALLELGKKQDAQTIIYEMRAVDSSSFYKDLIEAHRFVILEDFDRALDAALLIYERAPLNKDVLNFTARLYSLNGQKSKATQVYEEYLRLAPEDIESKFILASLLVEIGQMEKAEVIVDELMLIGNTNGYLNQLKGIIRSANEDYENGLLYSERAIQYGRNDPKLKLIAGFSAFRLDDFEKAVLHFSSVTPVLPEGHPAYRFLTVSYLKTDQAQRAVELLPKIGNLAEEDVGLLSKAAYDLLLQGNVEAAKNVIEQTKSLSDGSEDLTKLGILQLALDDPAGLSNLEKAAKMTPDSIATNINLGLAYVQSGEFEKALSLARTWQSNAPSEVEPYLFEADVLQRQGNYTSAREAIEKAASFAPDNTKVLVEKFRLLTRQNQNDEALQVADTLLDKDPKNIVGLAGYYHIYSQRGEAEQALSKIKSVFEKHKNDQDLALLLARVSLLSNNTELSLRTLEAIEANRDAPDEFWSLKGNALLQSGQFNAAQKHFEDWAEISPNNQEAVVGKLRALNEKREYKDAALIASEFLSKKDSTQIRILNAHFYSMLNEPNKAKTLLDGVDTRALGSPFVSAIIARINLMDGKFESALENANRAYDEIKTSENLFLLVQALQVNKQEAKVTELINSHLQAFPDDLSVKLLLAERLSRTDRKTSISLYEEALASAPNNYLILNNLAFLLMMEGELNKAENYAQRAYKIEPNNVGIVDTYAQVLIKKGDVEEAVEAYSSVINDNVNNEDIILNYIEALLINGAKMSAKRRLESREFRSPLSTIRIRELKEQYSLDI